MFDNPLSQFNDKPIDRYNLDYKAIYISCFPMIRSMVLKNSGTVDDAKDIFQESLIVLFQQFGEEGFKLKVNSCTYLYSVARNLWLKMLRSKFNRISDEDIDDKRGYEGIHDDDFKHKQRLLVKHIATMGERCQNIISLYFEGISGEEIARKLEFSSYEYYRVAKNRCIENLKKVIQKDPLFKELIEK